MTECPHDFSTSVKVWNYFTFLCASFCQKCNFKTCHYIPLPQKQTSCNCQTCQLSCCLRKDTASDMCMFCKFASNTLTKLWLDITEGQKKNTLFCCTMEMSLNSANATYKGGGIICRVILLCMSRLKPQKKYRFNRTMSITNARQIDTCWTSLCIVTMWVVRQKNETPDDRHK